MGYTMANLTFEANYPIWEDIYGAVFSDNTVLTNDSYDFSGDVLSSAGLGVRYITVWNLLSDREIVFKKLYYSQKIFLDRLNYVWATIRQKSKKEKTMNSKQSLNRFKTLQALYVEDDAVIRESIGFSLGYYFGEVITAASYDEALKIYGDEAIDILFVDIEMPGKSGIELVETIRAQDRKIPIVMVTAYSDKHYLMQLINQNIQHYLIKPVTLERLEEALSASLHYFDTDELDLTLKEGISYLPKEGIVRFNDQDVHLSARERVLVNLLLTHKNHYVSYAQIEDEVWYPDIMSKSALKSMIYNLRKKLPSDCIKTYAKEGYVLQCD